MMNRMNFLVGISAAALAAGTASAQVSTNGTTTDANGNVATIQCSPANYCQIDNSTPDNELDRASIRATAGSGNEAYIYQRGDDDSSSINQSGNNNYVNSEQYADRQRATQTQSGDNNYSEVYQGGGSSYYYGLGASNGNSATVSQSSTAGSAGNYSGIYQGYYGAGERNTAAVTQDGENLDSEVYQETGYYYYEGGVASDNSATVVQAGTGSESDIYQYSRGNSATVRMIQGGANTGTSNAENYSYVQQANDYYRDNGSGGFTEGYPTGANNPRSLNVADVSISGQQNSSSVYQDGVQNSATVSMLGGGAGNTGSAPVAAASNGGRTTPANRMQGNSSYVTQSGRGLMFAISSGGLNGQGNISDVRQGDDGLGRDHRATVYQRGVLDNLAIRQNNNDPTGTMAQFGSVADVSQLSFNSTASVTQYGTNNALVSQGNRNEPNVGGNNLITVTQTDAGDTPTSGGVFGGAGTTPASNSVAISQNGLLNTIGVNQNAVNASATVWQQPGASGAVGTRNSTVTIEQGTGVALNTGGAPGYNTAANTGAGAMNLTANVTQSGRAGTGTAAYGLNVGVSVSQNGQNLSATATQAGFGLAGAQSSNAIGISQVNSFSSATVSQNGSGLTAIVDQRSTNATATKLSLVTIDQAGTSNVALARQTTNAGASTASAPAAGVVGDANFPFARSAGANSAEIAIFQRAGSTGNSATVEQRGRGQYGRLDQSGNNNIGGILQTETATNAVAILEQRGNNNSFYITQDQAGQYIRVYQGGNNNAVASTSTTQSTSSGFGPGGTVSTTTAPTPAFGTVN